MHVPVLDADDHPFWEVDLVALAGLQRKLMGGNLARLMNVPADLEVTA